MLRTMAIVPSAVVRVEPATPSAKGPTVAGYQFQCGCACDIALIKLQDPSAAAVSLTPAPSSESTHDHPVYGPALQPAEAPAAEEAPASDETLEGASEDVEPADVEGDTEASEPLL
eukprot:tig00021339_g20432.t1